MKARSILCLFCAGRDRLETFVTGNIPQNSPFAATRMIIHDISGKKMVYFDLIRGWVNIHLIIL